MSTLRRRAIVALAAATAIGGITLAALPASAAPVRHHAAVQLRNPVMGLCLTGPAGRIAYGSPCARHHVPADQRWRLEGGHLVSGAGECLTATAQRWVLTRPCGQARQSWRRHGLEFRSRSFPGLCLYFGEATFLVQVQSCRSYPATVQWHQVR